MKIRIDRFPVHQSAKVFAVMMAGLEYESRTLGT